MAKKKSNIPADVRWINTPFVYTTKFAGLNLLQQDVLVRVSDHIQEYVTRYFEENRHLGKEIPRPLFSKTDFEDGMEPVCIQLSDLGVDAGHYERLEKAIAEALSIQFRGPYVDPITGEKSLRWQNVFIDAKFPLTDNGFNYKSKKSGEMVESVKKKGYVEFRINKDIADYAFDMSKGYINHPNIIARISKTDYTPTFYSLLKNKCFDKEGNLVPVRLTVENIKDALHIYSFVEVEDPDTKVKQSVKEYQYPKYSQFKKGVLMRIQQDLDTLGANNQIDYTFTFTEIRKQGKTTGDPLFVDFMMVKTLLGEERDRVKHRFTAEKELVIELTKEYPSINGSELARMASSISNDDYVSFSLHIRLVREAMSKNKPQDPAAYLMKSIRKWVSEHTPTPIIVESDLFAGLDGENVHDFVSEIQDALKFEFGVGQKGYDYFFGSSVKCVVGEDNKSVIISMYKSVRAELESSFILMQKVEKSVKKVLGVDSTFSLSDI